MTSRSAFMVFAVEGFATRLFTRLALNTAFPVKEIPSFFNTSKECNQGSYY